MDSTMYNSVKNLPEYILLSGAGRKRFWNLIHQKNINPKAALLKASRGKTVKKISELQKTGQLMSAIQKRKAMPDFNQFNFHKKNQKTQHIDKATTDKAKNVSTAANVPTQKNPNSSELGNQAKRKSKLVSLVEIHNTQLMSNNEMTLIHDALLLEIAKGEAGKGPRFYGFFYKKGFILILCENHYSQNWLVKTIETLKPWPEAKLSTKIKNKTLIASTFLPGQEADTVEKALKLLQIQNKGLHTEEWKVLTEREFQGGRVVTFSMDRHSFEALKASKFKALLGFRNIFIKIINPQPQELSQPNEAEESTFIEECSAENEIICEVNIKQEVNLDNESLVKEQVQNLDQNEILPDKQEETQEQNQEGEVAEISEQVQEDQLMPEPCWDEEL